MNIKIHYLITFVCALFHIPDIYSKFITSCLQPKKIIGYVGHICRNCNESESLPVMYDPYGVNSIFRRQHICDPQNLDFVRRSTLFFREDVCSCES